VVTNEELPMAYEVLNGNTADKTTLRPFSSISKHNKASGRDSG